MTQDEIIQEFNTSVSNFSLGEVYNKGAILGVLTRACGSTENRHLFLKVLTGKFSSKLLTDAEWFGVLRLVQPEKPIGGIWQSKRGEYELRQICGTLLARAVSQPGQQTLPF